MHNRRHILVAITLLRKKRRDILEIGDRVTIVGRLLGPIAAIQIAANRGVSPVARKLTHVIDMIRHSLEPETVVAAITKATENEHYGISSLAKEIVKRFEKK